VKLKKREKVKRKTNKRKGLDTPPGKQNRVVKDDPQTQYNWRFPANIEEPVT
jgi:hypothetical protein